MSRSIYFGACLLLAGPVSALAPPPVPEELRSDIVFIGEFHDNPQHKHSSAELIDNLQPSAIVWEMLSKEEAARVTHAFQASGYLEALSDLDLDTFDWPDLKSYYPIFDAGYFVPHYGAHVVRSEMGTVRTQGSAAYFGPDADRFGLTEPLAETEQRIRETKQQANHCNALPEDLLPFMVSVQRLRDAELARTALQALDETGGPIVVVTGNGHARTDWGAPVYVRAARPDVTTASLGHSEAGRVAGTFDVVFDSAPIDRPDPCAAFGKN